MTEIADGSGVGQAVTVAVVDDDPRIGRMMALYLQELGCGVDVYADAACCLAKFREKPTDIVITDLQMPGLDGFAVLREVKERAPSTEVIVVTGHADKSSAVQALRLGAFDFFEKPVEAIELTETVKRTLRYRRALQERDRFAEQLSAVSRREAARWGIDAFVGESKSIRKILDDIRLLQRSPNTSVLITGESGTGKELVARAVHFGSPRAVGAFVPVNCSAIPAELAESTLFGHVRGAFTGATVDKKGCFALADGGTIFLDEIGDMPVEVQIKLLRVLEDGVVVPVGKTSGQRVDVRVVAATNADLANRIASGAFRLDLFYRLAGFTLQVPPLRGRRGDISLLAEHFAQRLSTEMGLPSPAFSPEAMAMLQQHPFPGNVRELRNTVERALICSEGQCILPVHLQLLPVPQAVSASPSPAAPAPGEAGSDLPLNLAEAERILIGRAMQATDGNLAAAARLLGINRTKLYRRLAVLGA